MRMHSRSNAPLILQLLSLPAGIVPVRVHSTVIARVLNRVFAESLRDGEMNFLQGNTVCVHVKDIRLKFSLAMKEGRLTAGRTIADPSLSIEGNLHSFMQLAARSEDSDTLFFQRRLRMQGSTELGLEVKNFLDGLDVDSQWLFRQFSLIAKKLLPTVERLTT